MWRSLGLWTALIWPSKYVLHGVLNQTLPWRMAAHGSSYLIFSLLLTCYKSHMTVQDAVAQM